MEKMTLSLITRLKVVIGIVKLSAIKWIVQRHRGPYGPAVIDDCGADWEQGGEGRWCLLFRLGPCLNFHKQGIEVTYSNCNLINENCPMSVFLMPPAIFSKTTNERGKRKHTAYKQHLFTHEQHSRMGTYGTPSTSSRPKWGWPINNRALYHIVLT